MEGLLETAKRLASSKWRFIRDVFNVNRDYPYHDYVDYEDGEEPKYYVVGASNSAARGDQSKEFVSKSTLIIATAECTVRFNNAKNVAITIPANQPIEFHANIWAVYISAIGTGGIIRLWFEGVLADEARAPE